MATTTWSGLTNGSSQGCAFIAASGIISATPTTLALDSAYTNGSAGDAAAFWFYSPATGNLTDFHIYVSAITGTGPTGATLNWEIRQNLTGANVTTGTVIDSGTISGCNTTGWKSVTGRTAALTAGRIYALIIADANGNGTNYATIYTGVSTINNNFFYTIGSTTANGFTTGTTTNKPPFAAWKIDGVMYGGACIDTMNTVTTGTYERGCRFRTPVSMTFAGVSEPQGDIGNLTAGTFYLYADATNPGGSALASFALPSQTLTGGAPLRTNLLFPSSSWYDLAANTWYRLTFKPNSNLTQPRKNYINNGGSSLTIPTDVKAACFPLGGNCYWTAESGGVFVDDANALCVMGPILVPGPSGSAGVQLAIPAAV